ncbi:AIR synthase related protein [Herbiconiux sp. CPCC 205763]|uniref:Thiamine-monophosphate kinase n=1 Tax=Herbiconiux aconitum TaxID=2970913 RepID=A0ABT2GRP5_9MICO|nr:AIR synthase related protein [Herbiconiux aconitum]MCS5718895.1 AIR synthase related protein [Herbiconiux aconitum]
MALDFGLPANARPETLAEVGEVETLRRIFPRLPHASTELLGPGDDAAVLAAPDGRYVVTTDMMIHGPDFRAAWSTAHDLGWKAAMTNLADVAAMGARPTALVVAIAAPLDTPVEVLLGIADGLRDACEAAAPGCGVAGGDLSVSATLTLAVTAFGDLEGRTPVTRAGAQPGDVVAVAGALGRAGAGIWLLFRDGVVRHAGGAARTASPAGGALSSRAGSDVVGEHTAGAATDAGGAHTSQAATEATEAGGAGAGLRPRDVVDASGVSDASAPPAEPDAVLGAVLRREHADLLEAQLAPTAPIASGVEAALGGATAMLDVSDGLVLDARRIAQASGCVIRFDPGAIAREARALLDLDAIVGDHAADFVLTGGEDHALLATFPPGVPLPQGFRRLGEVGAVPSGAAPQVLIGDRPYDDRAGWDPYADWDGQAG